MKCTLPLSLVKPLRHLLFSFVKLLFYINKVIAASLLQVQCICDIHTVGACGSLQGLLLGALVQSYSNPAHRQHSKWRPCGVIQGLTYTDLGFIQNV